MGNWCDCLRKWFLEVGAGWLAMRGKERERLHEAGGGLCLLCATCLTSEFYVRSWRWSWSWDGYSR